ncbi:hypothetical protein [Sphingomonas sp. IC4-52]|uniref:hypothetical protein n=1 Tax=Sphingomonas sp. IC4-52 TaxID=2887202 RepID=UPI001D11EB14|nr:hypothetical protein [Sphingomonas sp. IC4-52]MCC2979053.1 hypothetical protein [Sphingomonas sp. IC4-52]
MSMFAEGHSTDEVRKAIGQHFQRDAKTVGVLDLLTLGAVLVLTRHMEIIDRVAVWVAVFSILKGLRLFMDQVLRNWYLHRLDWDDAVQRERTGDRR